MEEKEYHRLAKELFLHVEQKLDELEEDVDYNKSDGKLDIFFENSDERVVLNTQRAIFEIWLAGLGKARHFLYDQNKLCWYAEAEQEEFYNVFSQMMSTILKRDISFE